MTFTRPLAAMSLVLLLSAAQAQAPAVPANKNPATVQAGTYALEPVHTRVLFSVSHMGFSTWYGDFDGASGSGSF